MIIYLHTVNAPTHVELRQEISADPAFLPDISGDPAGSYVSTAEHELTNHSVLKNMWNPETQEARQAIIEALPKIWVLNTAGLIQ